LFVVVVVEKLAVSTFFLNFDPVSKGIFRILGFMKRSKICFVNVLKIVLPID